MSAPSPLVPFFDSFVYIDQTLPPVFLTPEQNHDVNVSRRFLKSYGGSQGTFNSYRREVERLLQWTVHVSHKSLKELRREDIEAFIHFCCKPPKTWIALKKAPRFMDHVHNRLPNPEWRPFVATLSKTAHRKGERPTPQDFDLSSGSIKEIFAILSSFFNYLLQEDYASLNPVALIRQKSKFLRRQQGQAKIRRLSSLQWDFVITMAEKMAKDHPPAYERTLFMMSLLYALYLRISELTASPRWEPQMNHFYRDSDNNWWFTTVGKGNKQRDIAVSESLLEALKRWRLYLGLSPLPSPADQSPLLPRLKRKGPISSTTYVRKIVQHCFDRSIDQLQKEGLNEEATSLMEATVHWLRHTGISDDVKRRPREHVRDDAGHSSSATTDKYIDIELIERHKSARHKSILSQ